jgi:hypothetical protein
MTDQKKRPAEDEVSDKQLEDVAGGADSDTSKETKKSSKSIDGEATDADHDRWIDI